MVAAHHQQATLKLLVDLLLEWEEGGRGSGRGKLKVENWKWKGGSEREGWRVEVKKGGGRERKRLGGGRRGEGRGGGVGSRMELDEEDREEGGRRLGRDMRTLHSVHHTVWLRLTLTLYSMSLWLSPVNSYTTILSGSCTYVHGHRHIPYRPEQLHNTYHWGGQSPVCLHPVGMVFLRLVCSCRWLSSSRGPCT